MSTKIMFKMTIDEAKEELVANERMQEAIAEKFNWPELTDKEYIAAELRLSECQAEEEVRPKSRVGRMGRAGLQDGRAHRHQAQRRRSQVPHHQAMPA